MVLINATEGIADRWNRRRAILDQMQDQVRQAAQVHRVSLVIVAIAALLHLLSAVLLMANSSSGEAAGLSRLPVDESWTRLTYIKNFADSFAFQFNDGEASTGATSPLWIGLNGLLAAVFGLEGDSLPALTKIVGIGFGIATLAMVFRITWQLTRSRAAGAFAAAVLAVEPHFAFASVSGTEVSMTATLALAASWVFLRGRVRTSGVLAAVALTARPEAVLLSALIVAATIFRWMWRRDGAIFQQEQDVRDIAWLAVPSLLVIAIGITYSRSVTGDALPDSYLATKEALGLLPLSNLWDVWLGYLHELPFMDGLAWIVGLPLILLGMFTALRHHSFSAVPMALFSLALVYAAMVIYERPEEQWLFVDRRHMDAALPFIVVMLVTGTVRGWQLVRRWELARNPLTEEERKAVMITAVTAMAALVLIPVIPLTGKWVTVSDEYSWSSRNVNDVNVAMGKWLEENTPSSASIAAAPAGAIAFYSDRAVIDLSGKNFHDVHNHRPLTYGAEHPGYFVALRSPFFDSVPDREALHETLPGIGNEFQFGILRIYGPPVTDAADEHSRNEIALFDTTGLEIIDSIDVGNPDAPEQMSEADHGYGISGERNGFSITARLDSGRQLTDDARVFNIEELTVAARPGQPLTIVKRYDATAPIRLRVTVDGVEAGTWDLPRGSTFFGESGFTVPGEMVRNNRVLLRFEAISDQDSLAASSFFYWILAPTGTG